MAKKPGPKKGSPKTPGSGRKKGTVNKSTQLLKDAVLRAAELAGDSIGAYEHKLAGKKGVYKRVDGLVYYLKRQARDNPGPFMSLLGKVLPMQIGGTTDEGDGINITVKFE